MIADELIAAAGSDNVKINESMKQYVTFKAGGCAAYMVCPEDEKALLDVINICRAEKIPYFVLGRGSDLLVSDSGYDGVIINMKEHFDGITADRETGIITAQAGAFMPAVSRCAYNEGLGGLEFAAGIPGTIGGGLYMNAGAYGGELKDVVIDARVLTKDGSIKTVKVQDMALGHRKSIFQETSDIILSCRIRLFLRDQELIKADMDEYGRRRREKQPLEFPSGGSTFKRPQGYFAGKLIEDCGLKGYAIGDAQVSEKHAGFVINRGNASAGELYSLFCYIQKTVFEKFGVKMELEIQLLGNFE